MVKQISIHLHYCAMCFVKRYRTMDFFHVYGLKQVLDKISALQYAC